MSLQAIAFAGQATGAVIQAVAVIREGQAAAAAGEFNAQISEENARLINEKTTEELRRHRIVSRKLLGTTRARIGASGVAFQGSVIDVLEETAANAELDALTIRHGGQVQELSFLNTATIERFKGEQAKKGSKLKATGIILSGLSGAAGDLPSGAGASAACSRRALSHPASFGSAVIQSSP